MTEDHPGYPMTGDQDEELFRRDRHVNLVARAMDPARDLFARPLPRPPFTPVNHGMDRRLAELADAAWPGFHLLAHAHRAFVQRAVAWLTRAGIGQFLDIGSGPPTLGAVHEHTHPDARVVYVDIDPDVVTVAGHLLADQPNVGVITRWSGQWVAETLHVEVHARRAMPPRGQPPCSCR